MQTTNFLTGEISKKTGKRLHTKHAASKKGFVHKHNLSRGQLNHQKFISGK